MGHLCYVQIKSLPILEESFFVLNFQYWTPNGHLPYSVYLTKLPIQHIADFAR